MISAFDQSQNGRNQSDRAIQLSIIIVSFNTREITQACLQSIRDAELRLKTEVIVVDNASSDGSPEMIANGFPEVVLIRNEKNLMFSKANNQAMRIARGRYFFLLNSDTLIQSGNIEKLVCFIKMNWPRVGCVGPKVLRADGSIQSEGEPFDSFHYVLSRFFFLHKIPLPFFIRSKLLPLGFQFGMEGRTRKVAWVMGCSFLFPREIFEQLGGLDEEFVFYCEEMEFCYRLGKNGYEVWVIPEATITHLGGSSWNAAKRMGEAAKLEIPQYNERRFLFHQKTAGVKSKINTNRLQIFLCSSILPLLKLFRSSKASQMQEKIRFHLDENRAFFKLLAQDSHQPHNRS